MRDPLPIVPFGRPVDTTVVVPGSKSYTNRALVCAALAHGRSTVTGALLSDDTEAMVGCLRSLGVAAAVHGSSMVVDGAGAQFPIETATLNCRQSGTTARFVLPMLAVGRGSYVVDAHPQMLHRPMGDQVAALRHLGATIAEPERVGHLPLVVHADGLIGGAVSLPGSASSQFLSGLLLSGPMMTTGLDVRITTDLVSRSYVDLTVEVMRAFGATVTEPDGRDANRFLVAPGGYVATEYEVEPDASAASYFFALAAVTGGSVTVAGLGSASTQGDMALLPILARMGCNVDIRSDATTVSGFARSGVEVDMSDCSDVASTLAAVAAFAETPTRVTGIGFIRKKETDRIAAVVTELRRCGIDAEEEPDGFIVRPGPLGPAVIETYQDHRMAMSFAVLGARVPGISIVDPSCVNKTFPEFWKVFDSCRANYGGSP
jgi:3-phosphoshikimate 1-carboxyvinyltransferase